jgi:hypothetical protein
MYFYHPDFLFFQEANDIAIESGLTSLDSSVPFSNIHFKLFCKDGSFSTRIHASYNEMFLDFLSKHLFLEFRKDASFLIFLIFVFVQEEFRRKQHGGRVFNNNFKLFFKKVSFLFVSELSIFIKADLISFFDASSETVEFFRIILQFRQVVY